MSRVILSGAALAAAPVGGQAPDPHQWLEEVEGVRALEWVNARNAATLAELTRDGLYAPLFERTRALLDATDRIAMPSILGDHIYNFWQDAGQPRGIWRRSGFDAYVAGEPRWETLLDVDALARDEGVPWAFGGASCLAPDYRRCLVQLSRGGADAVEVREFDMTSRRFVADGFRLPEAKQSVAWVDGDALLVASDFGPGSMTTSGYARSARLWRRGNALADAPVLFEAPGTDMGVWVARIETAGRAWNVLYHRTDFYSGSAHVLRDGAFTRLDVPLDADPHIVRDRLIVYLRSPWRVGGAGFDAGAVIDIGMNDFLAGDRAFTLVLQPGGRQTVEAVAATRDHLLVAMLDNVRGELRRYTFAAGAWTHERVDVPDMGSVAIAATSAFANRWFFTWSGYTQPTTLYLVEGDGAVREVARLPAQFDATGLVVEQHEVASRDGTRVPYFVVHRRDLPLDGRNPTLLYGYGGFEVSLTPAYGGVTGASWLERGGVYVVANIRGGGEFGPQWHRAALKENRQRAFDDFIAVAEDLIARRITTPERLGIMGGSNGGLLVGAVMTQRPELFGAVVIQVPLLDMRRYHLLLAGASWMAEYGNPDVPEEWAYMQRWSPYHNLRPDVRYPHVLFTTTTRDDRVHPGHARKMAARMAEMGLPFHYYENTEGGHGAGVTSEQRARMHALTFTWLWTRLAPGPASDSHPSR